MTSRSPLVSGMVSDITKAANVVVSDNPKKKRLNTEQRRALKAASVQIFIKQYGRKAQKDTEPNDRSYDRDLERAVKQMRPEELDALLRDQET